MELSTENRRTRAGILVIAWAIAAVLLVLHTVAMEDYVALLDSLGRRGADRVDTPLQRPIPTVFADTQSWARHALTLLETGAGRIRFTDHDNAPHGREVHWSSGFAWLVAAGGWLRHVATGEPLPLAVERSLGWFNLPLFLAVMIGFSAWTARRAGAAAGVLVALAMVGSTEFSNGFSPSFVDHHGLLAAANFGLALGALFMGAGWIAPAGAGWTLLPRSTESARRAVLFSALSGAVGMGISAASVVPGIAIVGVAGLLVTVWLGRPLRPAGARFDPALWRLWGRVGGGASFAFYLLEYAPQHLGWRLEVNHPLLALAWWGAGELIAALAEWRLGPPRPAAGLRTWLLPLVAVLAAPATILIGGAKVFVIRDPLILALSQRVAEGLSLPDAIRAIGPIVAWVRVPWAVVTLGPAAFLLARRGGTDRLVIAFGTLVVVAFLAMGWFQIRFFANAGGPQIALLLVVLAAALRNRGARARWLAVLAVAAVLCLPERIYRIIELRQSVPQRSIAKEDLLQPLYRDIAAVLRREPAAGDIILLTNPDASTGIGYFGRLQTIGTLYWENLDGIKAAAAMHAATALDGARALMLARRVTHVALISESSFVPDYFALAHPGAPADAWMKSVGYHWFAGRNLPLWLEQVPYEPPADIPIPKLRVMLYRTRFGPAAAEEFFRIAGEKARAGDFAAAEAAVGRALALDGSVPEFLKLRAELLLARGALTEALPAMENLVAQAPGSHRGELARSAAETFYQRGDHAAAARLYRTSLELQYDPMAVASLAWILATSRDPSVRDGATALALAQRVASEDPQSYTFVSALAAALAERGQFAEAVTAGARAVELARAAGDPGALATATTRLRTYQAGQPLRQ